MLILILTLSRTSHLVESYFWEAISAQCLHQEWLPCYRRRGPVRRKGVKEAVKKVFVGEGALKMSGEREMVHGLQWFSNRAL